MQSCIIINVLGQENTASKSEKMGSTIYLYVHTSIQLNLIMIHNTCVVLYICIYSYDDNVFSVSLSI